MYIIQPLANNHWQKGDHALYIDGFNSIPPFMAIDTLMWRFITTLYYKNTYILCHGAM